MKKIFHGDWTESYTRDSFTSIHSTYDFAYDKGVGFYIGHTWKPYYFYYKAGKVYEYKAKKYRKYGKVKSIFYRENGLVHVNYKGGGVRMNVTFRVSGNRLKKPVVNEGIYRRRITKQKGGYNYEKNNPKTILHRS